MNVKIRLAKLSDFPSILGLIKQLYKVKVAGNYHLLSQENFEVMLKNRSNLIFVAQLGEATIGFLHCNYRYTMGQGKILLVDENVVDESFHGQGIGMRLLNHLNSFATEKEASEIEVSVDLKNTSAFEFYKKAGFREKQNTLVLQVK